MSGARNLSKRDRILDVAEELFALHGYDGVTLRQIATGAGVDVALASYHFGKKLDLFNAVFLRRAAHLNETRLTALSACQQSAGKKGPSVEQIIEAFLRPLELAQETGDPGWRHYLALIAYINNSPYWGPRMMSKLFDDLVLEFIAALRKALPRAADEDLYWCYHNLSGALTLTLAQTGRIDKLSGGKCRSEDFEAAYDHMIPFVAAGFREVCNTRVGPRSVGPRSVEARSVEPRSVEPRSVGRQPVATGKPGPRDPATKPARNTRARKPGPGKSSAS